jgi:hypothetical protein
MNAERTNCKLDRHQYKKAAMLAYAIAASAGSRGNAGKLRPAGRGQSGKRASEKTVFSGFVSPRAQVSIDTR